MHRTREPRANNAEDAREHRDLPSNTSDQGKAPDGEETDTITVENTNIRHTKKRSVSPHQHDNGTKKPRGNPSEVPQCRIREIIHHDDNEHLVSKESDNADHCLPRLPSEHAQDAEPSPLDETSQKQNVITALSYAKVPSGDRCSAADDSAPLRAQLNNPIGAISILTTRGKQGDNCQQKASMLEDRPYVTEPLGICSECESPERDQEVTIVTSRTSTARASDMPKRRGWNRMQNHQLRISTEQQELNVANHHRAILAQQAQNMAALHRTQQANIEKAHNGALQHHTIMAQQAAQTMAAGHRTQQAQNEQVQKAAVQRRANITQERLQAIGQIHVPQPDTPGLYFVYSLTHLFQQEMSAFYHWYSDIAGTKNVTTLLFELPEVAGLERLTNAYQSGSAGFQALQKTIWEHAYRVLGNDRVLTCVFRVVVTAPISRVANTSSAMSRVLARGRPSPLRAIAPTQHHEAHAPRCAGRVPNYGQPSILQGEGVDIASWPSETASALQYRCLPADITVSLRLQLDNEGRFSAPYSQSTLLSSQTTSKEFFWWFSKNTGYTEISQLKFTFKDSLPERISNTIVKGNEEHFDYMKANIIQQSLFSLSRMPELVEFAILVTVPGWRVEEYGMR